MSEDPYADIIRNEWQREINKKEQEARDQAKNDQQQK